MQNFSFIIIYCVYQWFVNLYPHSNRHKNWCSNVTKVVDILDVDFTWSWSNQIQRSTILTQNLSAAKASHLRHWRTPSHLATFSLTEKRKRDRRKWRRADRKSVLRRWCRWLRRRWSLEPETRDRIENTDRIDFHKVSSLPPPPKRHKI